MSKNPEEMTAAEWLKQNKRGWGPGVKKPLLKGEDAKTSVGRSVRMKRANVAIGDKRVYRHPTRQTIKEFVESKRDFNKSRCLFVPAAQKDVPAKVSYCGKSISAARYMCLLTHGHPGEGAFETRHLCGNGHLSCVNPKHLRWGTRGDNMSDQQRHRYAGDSVQDKIAAVTRD